MQSMVQYQQGCDTDVKYNNEPSKTGVHQNAPVGSWRAGMQHQNSVIELVCGPCGGERKCV